MINYLFFLNLLSVMSQYNSKTYSYTNTPTLINSYTASYTNTPTLINSYTKSPTPLSTVIVKSTFTNPVYPSRFYNELPQEYKIKPYTASLYKKVLIKKNNYSDFKFENNIEKTDANTTETNNVKDLTITINLNKIVLLIHIINISYIINILIKKFKELYN
jgi:hypothetical protein